MKGLCIRFGAVALGTAFGAGLLIMPNAFAVVDEPATFELDENAQDTTPPTGDDWETLWDDCGDDDMPDGPATECGNSRAFTGIVEDATTPEKIFTGGQTKDDLPLSGWEWKFTNNATPPKDNITDGFAAAYKNSEDETVVYFGADRYANNGDAQMGIWFFQEEVSPQPDFTFGTASHMDGDLLVLVNFTGNAQITGVEVWEWCLGCIRDKRRRVYR
jgi:hypothetical protein